MAKKIWSLLVHLEMSMWGTGSNVRFDEELWDEIVDRCVKSGFNTIVLDLGRAFSITPIPRSAAIGHGLTSG